MCKGKRTDKILKNTRNERRGAEKQGKGAERRLKTRVKKGEKIQQQM